MTIQHLDDPKTPISDLLANAGSDGILIESKGQGRYALLPLDDDLIDYLIERSPKLIEECRQIRARMKSGRFRRHDEVKKLLQGD